MTISYTVSYATTTSGPWTTAGTVTALTDVVGGLAASTTYYFEVVSNDSVTGLSSKPVIVGPITTLQSSVSGSGTVSNSANGTGGYTSGAASITDSTGAVWTLVPFSGTNPYGQTGTQIAINGVVDTTTAAVTTLLWYNGTMYQANVAGNWYSYGGTPGSYTQIAGDPRPSAGPIPPAQATGTDANGNPFIYTNLVLASAPFTSDNDVGRVKGQKSNSGLYQWSPGSPGGTVPYPGGYSVSNGALVVQYNFQEGEGISTVNFGNNPTFTDPGNRQADIGNGLVFKYGYYQSELAFNFNGSGYTPSWWAWGIVGTLGNPNNYEIAEFDFLEIGYPNNGQPFSSLHEQIGGQANPVINATPGGGGAGALALLNTDGVTFNKYGFLWTPTAVQFFYNDHGGTPIPTTVPIAVNYAGGGSGPSMRTMVGCNQSYNYIMFGASPTWPLRIKSFNVWQ